MTRELVCITCQCRETFEVPANVSPDGAAEARGWYQWHHDDGWTCPDCLGEEKVIILDGEIHRVPGRDRCGCESGLNQSCRCCGGFLHFQGCYGGAIFYCEECETWATKKNARQALAEY